MFLSTGPLLEIYLGPGSRVRILEKKAKITNVFKISKNCFNL